MLSDELGRHGGNARPRGVEGGAAPDARDHDLAAEGIVVVAGGARIPDVDVRRQRDARAEIQAGAWDTIETRARAAAHLAG